MFITSENLLTAWQKCSKGFIIVGETINKIQLIDLAGKIVYLINPADMLLTKNKE